MYFIGDVHGKLKSYLNLIGNLPESIQVGDMGIGFTHFPEWDKKHKFIRGNHDSPKECRAHPNYLGDYGITEDGIFFVSGAFSIDYMWRKNHNLFNPDHLVWWPDEEIAEGEFEKILSFYQSTKPEIVVAHDAPNFVKEHLPIGGNVEDKKQFSNRTSNLLMEDMFKIWQPDIWVFGHYHVSAKFRVQRTKFVCLNELEVTNTEKIIRVFGDGYGK